MSDRSLHAHNGKTWQSLEQIAGTVAGVRNGSTHASKAIGEVDAIIRQVGARTGPI